MMWLIKTEWGQFLLHSSKHFFTLRGVRVLTAILVQKFSNSSQSQLNLEEIFSSFTYPIIRFSLNYCSIIGTIYKVYSIVLLLTTSGYIICLNILRHCQMVCFIKVDAKKSAFIQNFLLADLALVHHYFINVVMPPFALQTAMFQLF